MSHKKQHHYKTYYQLAQEHGFSDTSYDVSILSHDTYKTHKELLETLSMLHHNAAEMNKKGYPAAGWYMRLGRKVLENVDIYNAQQDKNKKKKEFLSTLTNYDDMLCGYSERVKQYHDMGKKFLDGLDEKIRMMYDVLYAVLQSHFSYAGDSEKVQDLLMRIQQRDRNIAPGNNEGDMKSQLCSDVQQCTLGEYKNFLERVDREVAIHMDACFLQENVLRNDLCARRETLNVANDGFHVLSKFSPECTMYTETMKQKYSSCYADILSIYNDASMLILAVKNIDLSVQDVREFSGGYAAVRRGGIRGNYEMWIDAQGNQYAKDCFFDSVGQVVDGFATVTYNGQSGVYSFQCQKNFPLVGAVRVIDGHKAIYSPKPGMAGIIDLDQLPSIVYVLAPEYRDVKVLGNGIYGMQDAFGLWGCAVFDSVTNTIHPVCENVYHDIGVFSQGCACVQRRNEGRGFIHMQGDEFIPCVYDKVFPFSEGCGGIVSDGVSWFVDFHGKQVGGKKPCMHTFTGNAALFDTGGSDGDMVLSYREGSERKSVPQKATYRNVGGDLFAVSYGTTYIGCVSAKGDAVLSHEYKEIIYAGEGCIWAQWKNGNWVLYSITGKQLSDEEYASVQMFSGGFTHAKNREGKRICMNAYGEVAVQYST